MTVRSWVVAVAGAASGIGRATAVRFAGEGCPVAMCDVDETGLLASAELIHAQGGECIYRVGDVFRREDVEAFVEAATREFGRLDVMVACAGFDQPRSRFVDVSDDVLEKTLAVNVRGVFLCGQLAARQMIVQGEGGAIVNVASIYADLCGEYSSAYCASKGAVRSLTRAMAFELGTHGIRVNAVSPGHAPTAMDPLDGAGDGEKVRGMTPLNRAGGPEDIASAIWLLAGPDAGYVHGQNLIVDGGMTVVDGCHLY